MRHGKKKNLDCGVKPHNDNTLETDSRYLSFLRRQEYGKTVWAECPPKEARCKRLKDPVPAFAGMTNIVGMTKREKEEI